MLTNRMAATDANENDRLMAGLAYFLTPIVPIIILLVDSMKVRAFQKYHAIQALGFFVVAWVIGGIAITIIVTICSIVTFGLAAICLWVLYFVPIIPAIYYAIIAYQGAYFEIPWLTKFMMQQGWLQPPGSAPMSPGAPSPMPPPPPPSAPMDNMPPSVPSPDNTPPSDNTPM